MRLDELFLDRAVKPWLRPARWRLLARRSRRIAERPVAGEGAPPEPMVFIIGCGRSGTTILSKLLAMHPAVTVLVEPYALWAAVNPVTDVTNLFSAVESRFVLRGEHANDDACRRFFRLIHAVRTAHPGRLIVEKTPHNAARIEFLERVAPGSSYLHIARDGVEVARSIDQFATQSTYRMIGRPQYNQWWGSDNEKWKAIERDGRAISCCPEEIPQLRTHAARGAYEWIISVEEIERHRDVLGERLLDLSLESLARDPRAVLREVARHLTLDAPDDWLAAAAAKIRPSRARREGAPLALPKELCARFNTLQSRYGFEGRARTEPAPGEAPA